MLVETVSDAHVHFHYSARRFRDVLLANILASQNKKDQVNSEGKADKAGIQEGCLINTINSAPVDHLTSSEAQALVRNSSSTLALGINRQTKSHDAVQNDQHRKVEVKATVDKNKPVNETEGQTGNKKGKKVRKRRRKKKPANRINSPEDGQQSNAGPVKIVEQVTKSLPKIEIVSASSDLRVDELEWIKNNEALLISELETRRQAGSPIQVLVRVEKITPSRPEYCQILPDCCHLDVINEETSASASDEDPKRERPTMPEGPSSNGIDPVEMVENKNGDSVQVDSISESVCRSVGEPETKLESPSLVRKSQELRYAESQVPTKNDDATFVEQIDSDDDVTVKEMDCVKRESTAVNCSSWTVTTKSENYANGFMKLNDILQDDNVVLDKFDEYDSYNEEQQRLITDMFPIMESQSEEQDYKEVGVRDVAAVVNGRLTAAHPRGKEFLETVGHDGYGAHDRHRLGPYQYSSDDSTVKDYEVRARVKHHARTDRGRRQIDVRSVYEKLRAVARLIRDDTDDYEDTTSYRTVSGGPSDLDTDSDWLSYTLSDEGESSRSLCLSPSQQSRAPSTASEASDIIELHKKFSDRAKIPNPCRSTTVDDLVEILGYGPPPSSPTCPTYSAEVIDEACRMCGTSDEPLSDAHRLVSLRKYQETRSSRLLNVIQQECRRSDRSASTVAIDRPPTMTDSNNNNNNDNCTFIDTLSVPDNQTRELMYAEYMEKVKERERRLNNKVIRITRPGRPLSSSYGTQLDVDAEFVAKARERLEKLGVDTTDMEFVEPKHDQNGYPRHLMDIVPEDEVCIEEVRMSGVWSPEVKHRTLNLENAVSRKTEKKPPTPSSELPPVWTPNSSPTPERKAYKPVRFESPTLSRKQINGDTQKVGPKKPSDLHVLSSPYPPAPPLLSQNSQGDDNAHRGTERRLPRVQSPTITLLQKAREGQLPRGSAYLDPEESNMNKENKNKGSSGKRNVDTKTINFTARRDYASGSEEKKQRKMLETSPKKYDGIGPTTKEGVPIVLRSEVKEPDQQKWYKQMYESLHKFQTDDDGVTVRYRTITREPKSRNTNGYLSEPERGYESYDDEYSRLSPVKSGQDRYKNQPRPIENYEPGHSSIAEKETRQWWDEAINAFDEHVEQKIPLPHNRSSSKKSNLAQALKESGYDSDSTLVFRRGENQPQCLSPTEQKTAYKMIQNGGEVPFQGLRKAAPERPKDSPHKYAESEVTLQYRRPVRNEIKEEWSEEELAMKQAEAMRRIYQEERRRKYLQELQDMSNRRHADNLLPSQKSPIALNRYDDFLDESPQPPRSRTPEPKLVARALYNFIGQTSRELSFRKGDIIFVRKQIDKNWYEGEHNAMVGLFPFNYVEVIPYDGVRTTPHRPYEGQARAKFNFLAQTNMELSLVKGELVVLTRRVDNNWYEGRIGSRKGIFPVSYVTVLVEPGDAPSSSMSASAKPVASPASHSLITSNPPNTQHTYQPDSYSSMPTRTSGTQTKKLANNNMSETLHVDVHSEPIPYRALYNYKPQNNDELELREGDVVFVMEKCDDGWYVGSSKRTGCFGTFPGNYVQRSV
ncbi:uncharacterized protein LOC126838814 isoform X8 [Adelges cooleyi]|uniref:uncharacterized protein LOC126838814 isoform X8 n=1 Tax=Adelges cooleyi TaxID=133065 RepID=UPI00217FE84C|nr:uncharacterized protein LOC126838814 isoform X8 [Adelges cooleyi]